MFGRFVTPCPTCKRRFGVRVAKAVLVKSEQESEGRVVNVPVGAGKGVPPSFTQATEKVSVTRKVYEITYRCTNCGNSWTESKVKVSRG